jgi:hypothetical protein
MRFTLRYAKVDKACGLLAAQRANNSLGAASDL